MDPTPDGAWTDAAPSLHGARGGRHQAFSLPRGRALYFHELIDQPAAQGYRSISSWTAHELTAEGRLKRCRAFGDSQYGTLAQLEDELFVHVGGTVLVPEDERRKPGENIEVEGAMHVIDHDDGDPFVYVQGDYPARSIPRERVSGAPSPYVSRLEVAVPSAGLWGAPVRSCPSRTSGRR